MDGAYKYANLDNNKELLDKISSLEKEISDTINDNVVLIAYSRNQAREPQKFS